MREKISKLDFEALNREHKGLVENWDQIYKEKHFKGPKVGMNAKEYYKLCLWINKYNLKNVVDFGAGCGSSWYMMNKFSNAEKIYSVEPDGRKEPWRAYFIPLSIPIYDFRIPEKSKEFDKFLKEHDIDFVLLDDGHQIDIVSEEINICYNNNIKYIAVHDTSGKPGIAVWNNKDKYDLIEKEKSGNGLSFLKIKEK